MRRKDDCDHRLERDLEGECKGRFLIFQPTRRDKNQEILGYNNRHLEEIIIIHSAIHKF
jgi:hypothetical protein